MEVPMQFKFKRFIAGLVFASILGSTVPAHAGFLDTIFDFWGKTTAQTTDQREKEVVDFVNESSETGKVVLAGGALALVYTAFRFMSKAGTKPSTFLFGLLSLLGFTADTAAQRMNEGKKAVEDAFGVDQITGAAADLATGVAQTTQEAHGLYDNLTTGLTNFFDHIKTFFTNIGNRFDGQAEAQPVPAPQPQPAPAPQQGPAPAPQPQPAPINNNNRNPHFGQAQMRYMHWITERFENYTNVMKKSIDDFLDANNHEKYETHIARMAQNLNQMKTGFARMLHQHNPNMLNAAATPYDQIINVSDTIVQSLVKMNDDLYAALAKKSLVPTDLMKLKDPLLEQNKNVEQLIKRLNELLTQYGQQQLAARIVNAFTLLQQNALQQLLNRGAVGIGEIVPKYYHRYNSKQ